MKQTETLKLNLPEGTDGVDITKFNDNFTILDGALSRVGAGNIKTLSDVALTQIKESGVYLIENLINPPDIPSKDNRQYLVEIYRSSTGGFRCPMILSYGTGKRYYATGNGYEDIPCTSPYQPSKVYIDSMNGNDDNVGDADNPIKTWECAYSRIPKILTKPLSIHFLSDINSPIQLTGITSSRQGCSIASSFILVYGDNHKVGKLEIANCHVGGASYGILLDRIKTDSSVNIIDSSPTYINNSDIDQLYCDCAIIRTTDNKVGNYEAVNNSYLYIKNHHNTDTGVPASGYGCVASFGGHIFVSGTHPQGSISEVNVSYGGKVEYEN